MLGNGFVATFAAVIHEKGTAMKSLTILTFVSALLLVFGTLAPSALANDKPAAKLVPFRLLFSAYDGDPKKDAPEKFTFQINTIDLKQPSEFLKLGERVPNTKWKLTKFRFKELKGPTIDDEDVSELTLTNTETKEEILLILNRVTDTTRPAPKK